MLTLLVFPVKEALVTVDGRKMKVQSTWAVTQNGPVRLRDCVEFADVADVEIFSMWRLKPLVSSLKLPEGVKKAIIDFLHTYHAKQDLNFDCYAFANTVCGVDRHPKSHLLNFWQLRKWRWWPKIGDVAFLMDKNSSRFHHAAIYIGHGLYISVWGAGGDLEVATLTDMKRDYKAKKVLLAAPR